MKTISQVAELTGISIRALQYYDEIGLLKPSELTLRAIAYTMMTLYRNSSRFYFSKN